MGLSPLWGHEHVSSHETSTGWFQDTDSKEIILSCDNLFHNQAKISTCMFKVSYFMLQDGESREINLSSDNLFHNQAKICLK